MTALGSTSPAAEADTGQEVARRALALLSLAMEVGMPEEFPERQLRRRLSSDEFEEAEEVYEGIREDPTAAFFYWEYLRWRDPKLYRELRKFWLMPPEPRLRAVPYWRDAYFESQNDVLRNAILELIAWTADEGITVPERNAIAESALLDIVERSPERKHRLKILGQPLGKVMPFSDDGYRRLLRLARGRDLEDYDLRADEVDSLTWSAGLRPATDEVLDYILRVAAGDPCERCQAMAIRWGIIKTYGKERVLPTYLAALRAAVNRSDFVAEQAILAVGVNGKFPEAVPYLIRALDLKNPRVRSTNLSGLRQATGLTPAKLGYEGRLDTLATIVDSESVKPAKIEALEFVSAKWKEWWRREGEKFLRDHGVQTEHPVSPVPPQNEKGSP